MQQRDTLDPAPAVMRLTTVCPSASHVDGASVHPYLYGHSPAVRHPRSVSPMLLLFLCIGLAAGILSGLFGLGGGILIVPSLVLLANFPSRMAFGTSLGALLLPVGLLGAYT